MSMSVWDQLKEGFKFGGGMLMDELKAALAIGSGFLTGGPAGAAMAAVPAVIGAVSDTAHRVSAYMHPTDADGTPNAQTIQGVVNPMKHVSVFNQALASVGIGSPDSTNTLASAGAKFIDSAMKYGDVTAASKAAGSSPITNFIGSGISQAVVNYAKQKIGFDAHNAMRYGQSATRGAQMLPTTSVYAGPVRDYMMNGGAEALAMRKLADYGPLNRSRDITYAAGSA